MKDLELNKMVDIKVKNSIIELDYISSPKNGKGETSLSHVVSEKVVNILSKDSKKEYLMLVNLLKVGDTGSPTSEARKVYAKMGSNKQLKKVAVCGSNIKIKVVANFIARLTGRKEFQWFDNLADARKWLKK